MIGLPGAVLGCRGTEWNKILEGILIIVILFIYSKWHSVVSWEAIERTFDANQWLRRGIHLTRSLTFQGYVGVS